MAPPETAHRPARIEALRKRVGLYIRRKRRHMRRPWTCSDCGRRYGDPFKHPARCRWRYGPPPRRWYRL